jgi:hypothetical protein
MSGFCLGERGLGRGQKLNRAGGPNAHVRFISAFPACPPAKSAAAGRAGARALPYHECVPRIRPGGPGWNLPSKDASKPGTEEGAFVFLYAQKGEKMKESSGLCFCHSIVTLFFLLLSFPLCSSFLERKNWLERAWS